MIDYAISTKHGIEIVTGYKIGKQYATHKASPNNWVVTDLASGLLIKQEFKTAKDAIDWAKNMPEQTLSELEGIKQSEGYKRYVEEITEWKDDNLPDQLKY